MRFITRSLAAGTVLTGMILAMFFSSLLAPVVVEAQARPISAAAPLAPRALPAGWAGRVADHLRRDPMPIESTEVDSILAIVERCAGRFDIDPLTVLAVIRVESTFDPFAVSPVGATGLMQLRADTAREVAARLDVEWTSDALLFEPETNVLLGTAYLRELLDRFGHLDMALAAFHAGPNRIAAQGQPLGAVSVHYTDRVWEAIVEYHRTARFQPRIS